MTAPPCVFFDDPLPLPETEAQRELGGKGLSLRRIYSSGLRVPAGFTISSSVCRAYLQGGGWPAGSWSAVLSAIARLADLGPRRACAEQAPPEFLLLAVRSGAAVSMPGLLLTRLNVRCRRSPKGRIPGKSDEAAELRAAIEEVFSSWNSPAATHYRQQNRIDDELCTAVTVQLMVECDTAGVMFTRTNPDGGSLVIEAVAGGGEKLVSGDATPCQWIVRRSDQRIISAPPEDDACCRIVISRLQELVDAGLRLEAEFDEPLDVEWGIDNEGVVLFQVRPIVTGTTRPGPSVATSSDLERLRAEAQNGGRYWVRHNLGETLISPTPLSWSLWEQFMSGSGGLGSLYRRLGFFPGRAVRAKSFLKLIGGEIYADPDLAAEMFGENWPLRYDIDELRNDTTLLDRAPRHFDVNRLDPFFLWRIPGHLWRGWRRQRKLCRLMIEAGAQFEDQALPEFLQFVSEEGQRDLSRVGDSDLPEIFEARRRRVMDGFGPESLLPGTLGGVAHHEFSRRLSAILGPTATQQAMCQLLPAGDVELMRRQLELLERIDEPDARAVFLEEFGHRAVGEMELLVPRWSETSAELAALVQRDSTELGEKSPGPDQETARLRLQELLRSAGAASFLPSVEPWFDHCWNLLPYRDRGKHHFLRGYELLRDVAQEVGRRCGLAEDVYFLTADEWRDLIVGKDICRQIDERKQERAEARRLQLSKVIDASDLKLLDADPPRDGSSAVLRGTQLVPGACRGVVCELTSGVNSAQENRVIVCGALEPSLLPMLTHSVGVVVERGGALSHGAILARQLGIPVLRLADATRRLHSGQLVQISGDDGQVEILRRGEPR